MRLSFALALALALPAADGGHLEDFEGPVTEGWERVDSDDHPPYNTFDLVRDPASAKSGSQFLRMKTLGGSMAIRLSSRRPWPVDASRAYRCSVHARLTGTRRNAAVLTLVWLNGDGDRTAEIRSSPLSQTGTWTELSLDIARIPAGAVAVAPRLDFVGDDVRGTCDFDRLGLEPVERLDVRPAGRTIPVFTADEYPSFTVSIDGAAGTHGVTVTLKSATGVEERRSAVLTLPSETPATVVFRPPGPGAHELTASVDGGTARHRFAVLVPNPWISPRDSNPPAAAIPDPAPAAFAEILALAGLASTPRSAAAPNGALDALLRKRIADPAAPVTLDRLFVDDGGNPTPALLALRAANDVLAGAVPLPDPGLFPANVRVAAFRKGDAAALALWSETGETDVPATFNESARLYPPLGALRPIRPGERLRIGPLPTFVVGIDPLLLEIRLALSGSDLPLQINPSARTLRLHNPSRTQALRDVKVRLVELPPGWRVTPRAISAAALAADAVLAEELQVQLPAGETERVQELRFDVGFVRNGKEQTVRLSRVVRLVSPLAIGCDVADGPRPGSKKVTVRVTNASDRAMTLSLRARLPHLPERTELLQLAPGATGAPLEFVVKDAHLTDPTRLEAEFDVQESVGARARARKVVPLR